MKVFISWSGPRSKAAAIALRDWIPNVIQKVECFMSSEDIRAGSRWSERIAAELSTTHFGIACLTPTNLSAEWLLFETGALGKALEGAFVCPYLIGVEPSQVHQPLAQFQMKRANKEETQSMMVSINAAAGKDGIDASRLLTVFEKWWPELEAELAKLPSEQGKTPAPARSNEDMLEEILGILRAGPDLRHGPIALTSMMSSSIADHLDDIASGYGCEVSSMKAMANGSFEVRVVNTTNGRHTVFSVTPGEGLFSDFESQVVTRLGREGAWRSMRTKAEPPSSE